MCGTDPNQHRKDSASEPRFPQNARQNLQSASEQVHYMLKQKLPHPPEDFILCPGYNLKITQHTYRSGKCLQSSREKTINGCQAQDNPKIGITKCYKTVITVFHNVKENKPEMSKRQEFFPEKWKLLFFFKKRKEF